jgi:4-diphosphocytidyl-2-C-methyl-D-erythritol kinase
VRDPVTVSAPAKLTRSLRITGVRPDGYHLLDTEMVSVDLMDTLEITPSPEIEISITDEVVGQSDASLVPVGETNLVVRALELLGLTARVRLVKRIPPGAGLGGGSSDAAAILRWAVRTDPVLAASLGADVPFCVRGGRSRVTGVGEVIEPLDHEDLQAVLLVPPLAVPTAAVYHAWDELFSRGVFPVGEPWGGSGNDLEQAALRVEPRLARWRSSFAEATGRRPRLAGSGSVWFVEGTLEDLGLAGHEDLVVGGQRGALVQVRAVPALL